MFRAIKLSPQQKTERKKERLKGQTAGKHTMNSVTSYIMYTYVILMLEI